MVSIAVLFKLAHNWKLLKYPLINCWVSPLYLAVLVGFQSCFPQPSQSQSSPWVWSRKPELPHPAPTSRDRRVSQAGKCRMAVLTCAGCSVLPSTNQLCARLLGSEACALSSLVWSPHLRRLAQLREPFLLQSFPPWGAGSTQIPSFSFSCCPTWLCGGFLIFSEVRDLPQAFSSCFVWTVLLLSVVLIFLWEKVSSMSYSSAILIQ